jgi:hypothetical protein
MVEMANPVYFDFVGKVEPPYILSPTQNLNLDTTYTIEETFMEQKQVRAQLQSPTQQYERQRHDSLFSYTPSIDSKPGDPSPHQAGIQPCFPAAQMTSEDYPLRPTNMSRSNSQYATFTNSATVRIASLWGMVQQTALSPCHVRRLTTQSCQQATKSSGLRLSHVRSSTLPVVTHQALDIQCR